MSESTRASVAARVGIVLMVGGLLLLIATAIDSWAGDDGDDGIATVEPIPDAADTAPSDDVVPPGEVDPSPGVVPDGFTTVQARITDADGDVCEVCLWLADDDDERGRGLMGVTDLGDAAGMAFVYGEGRDGRFWMFRTPTPLSIAWFADGGDDLVGTADMDPCVDVPSDECRSYSPESTYDLAIEVFRGDLDDLGIGPGSSVELIAGSEAERCPVAP